LTTTKTWRRARCVWVVAGLASASTLLSGCVSAVDESSAFGFSNPAKPPEGKGGTSIAEVIASDGKVSELTEAPSPKSADEAGEPAKAEALKSVASGEAARRIAEVAKPAPKELQTAASNQSTEPGKARSLLTPMSGPAITAFAQPQSGGREADRSLYASLYNESRARTPLKNAETGKSRRVVVLQREGAPDGTGDALPGVDPKSLFEIGQRASVDSELMDDIGGEYQIASLSGIARLAPSGLLVQRQDIQTNCFGRDLMGLISQIETRFRQKVVITSGMRTPQHNRRVNGAKASLHMACKAADLHVPGVNGQEVAKFVRALPNRGGVGTYCHTAAIHIDTGAQRDWNWPCRTRRAG